MVKNSIYKLSVENGVEWVFRPANSPWYQGAVESLVKNIKLALKFAIGSKKLRYSELDTAFKQAANQIRERLLGSLACSDSEVSVLTPNCLLLGRSMSSNPDCLVPCSSLDQQCSVVAEVSQQFWKRWCKFYVSNLFTSLRRKELPKNFQIGDVVVVAESNALRQGYFAA